MFNFFLKRKKKKIRKLIVGYENLKNEDKLNFINDIKTQFSKAPLHKKNLNDTLDLPSDLCLQQFLFYRLINLDFNERLIKYFSGPNTKLKYPLPLPWIKILIENGIKVDLNTSRLLWLYFQLKWYCIGIATGFLEIIGMIIKSRKYTQPFIYFEGLTHNNFPSKGNENNIVGWFLNQQESEDIKFIVHNVDSVNYSFKGCKIEYSSKFIVDGVCDKLKIAVKILTLIFGSIHRSKNRLLLRERVFQQIMKHTHKRNIAKIYFYNNSSLHFKPLWTYEVEKRNSKVVLIQYSTNLLPFKRKNKNYNIDFKWNYLSWKEYWVWNKTQKLIHQKYLKNKAKIFIRGAIPFNSKKINIEYQFPKNIVFVFPVSPWRKSFYPILGSNVEYYTDNCFEDFINLTLRAAKNYDVNIVIKEKRKSQFTSKKYVKILDNLRASKSVILINNQYSPFDLMDELKPLGVVSMPFTSTATIAKQKNIPSVYFDPTSKIDPHHFSNNDIQVIQYEKELEMFFSGLL